MMDNDSLLRGLQGSIAPCVLISAIGLLLLSMTNRLGRVTDRIRSLCALFAESNKQKGDILQKQILIFYRRCKLLRMTIVLSTLSIFFISTVILMLFSTLILSFSLSFIIKLTFAAGLICLTLSLLFFLADIVLTLKSIEIEIKNVLPHQKL